MPGERSELGKCRSPKPMSQCNSACPPFKLSKAQKYSARLNLPFFFSPVQVFLDVITEFLQLKKVTDFLHISHELIWGVLFLHKKKKNYHPQKVIFCSEEKPLLWLVGKYSCDSHNTGRTGFMTKWPLQPDVIKEAQHESQQFILNIVTQIFTKAEQVVLFFINYITYFKSEQQTEQ